MAAKLSFDSSGQDFATNLNALARLLALLGLDRGAGSEGVGLAYVLCYNFWRYQVYLER